MGQGEFRHVVTFPIVTDDVTGQTDLAYIHFTSPGRSYIAISFGVEHLQVGGDQYFIDRQLNASHRGVNPFTSVNKSKSQL